MRQVFSSPRLENVESVAKLLRDRDIEVRITNGRSYKGAIHGNFSYRQRENDEPQPTVWIVKSDDQPLARTLLREAGLLDSGRSPTSYLPTPTLRESLPSDKPSAQRLASRIKLGLLIGIVIVVVLAATRGF